MKFIFIPSSIHFLNTAIIYLPFKSSTSKGEDSMTTATLEEATDQEI